MFDCHVDEIPHDLKEFQILVFCMLIEYKQGINLLKTA